MKFKYTKGAFVVPLFFLFVNCPFPGSSSDGGDSGKGLSAALLALFSGSGGASTPDTSRVAAPVFTPAGGEYTVDQTVQIKSAGADIYYTNNGTDPTCPSGGVPASGTKYTTAIAVPSSITLKAIACKTGYTPSSINLATYTIDGTVAAPQFSPSSGRDYTSDLSVQIQSATPHATIFYTTDGTEPACSGMQFTGSIPLTPPSTTIIQAVACRTDWPHPISTKTSATYRLPSTTPTWTISPGSGLKITKATAIVITFSESMNTGSVTVTGTLGTATKAWSSSAFFSNDTLTLTPASNWNVGVGGTLTITGTDLQGNPAVSKTITFDVVGGKLYYVSPSGTSGYDCSTIATACYQIGRALYHYPALQVGDTVLVAGGTYNVNSDPLAYGGVPSIVIMNGISLYGGYSPDFQTRDPAAYPTIITDVCTGGYSSGCSSPVGAQSIIQPTVFDGFTVNGRSGDGSVAMDILSSAPGLTISNNIINGGTASPTVGFSISTSTKGVWLDSSSTVTLIGNTIRGGGGGDFSTAISISNSSPVIRNNVIDGGQGAKFSFGISTLGYSSSGSIQNNTIFGGTAGNSFAISLSNASTPEIDNNILVTNTQAGSVCIQEGDNGSDPASLRNNLFWGCASKYIDKDTNQTVNTICGGNLGDATCTTLLATPAGAGNVSANPVFINQAGGDYHLGASSPCSITKGGFDLLSAIPWDRDGITRTLPLSIGAYEWDGACQ